jgi:hypothetical protein
MPRGCGVPASIPWARARAQIVRNNHKTEFANLSPVALLQTQGSPSGSGRRSAQEPTFLAWKARLWMHAIISIMGCTRDAKGGQGGCQKEGEMLGLHHWGQSGVSVMGSPDKKLTDGGCAWWEKGENKGGTRTEGQLVGWSMLTLALRRA